MAEPSIDEGIQINYCIHLVGLESNYFCHYSSANFNLWVRVEEVSASSLLQSLIQFFQLYPYTNIMRPPTMPVIGFEWY